VIGQGPHQTLYRRGDLFVLYDNEFETLTLYRTVETFGQLKPKTEKTIKDEPYYYDLDTQMYYQLKVVAVTSDTPEGMDALLVIGQSQEV
jgi:hypothetical protein